MIFSGGRDQVVGVVYSRPIRRGQGYMAGVNMGERYVLNSGCSRWWLEVVERVRGHVKRKRREDSWLVNWPKQGGRRRVECFGIVTTKAT